MNLDCDGFADALADYLEGDAPEEVRSGVDAHAGSCAACRQLLADLASLRTDAAALPLLVPSRDLWTGIAERIDAPILPLASHTPVRTARPAWRRPALAAAALVAITAGLTHYLTRASLSVTRPAPSHVAVAPVQAPVALPPASRPAVDSSAEIVSTATERPVAKQPIARLANAQRLSDAADPVFASEISTLRQIVRERRARLDPHTVAVLEQSIAVMDSAIAQSRAALAHDPASGFLATQLNHSLEKKVELLRTVASLPTRL
ncbi:MAG: zf-HC2 domain-containing protein [bacterium]